MVQAVRDQWFVVGAIVLLVVAAILWWRAR